jgi:putative signal transducing protein
MATCPHCDESIAADTDSCPACGCLFVERKCDRHAARQAEGQCVVCSLTLCEECNQKQGRHFVCEEHAAVPLMSGWAQVFSAANDVEAELIRENLSSEGIEARVLSQSDHFSFVSDVGDLDQVRVLVPAYSFSEAVELLEEHKDSRGELAFACPNCGEAYEPGDVRCVTCGAALPVTPGSWAG